MASVGGTSRVQQVTLASGRVKWRFEWWNYRNVQGAAGAVERRREKTTESFDAKGPAETLRKTIDGVHAQGKLWEPASGGTVTDLRRICVDFSAAIPNRQSRLSRAALMNKFLAFVGGNAHSGVLSADLLRRYAASLEGDVDRSLDRYVGQVEQMWEWAFRHKQEYPGVPDPCRIVGEEVLRRPPPFAVATPTWAETDAMLKCLSGWHQQVGILLRYLGCRPSQVLTLEASDVNLDGAWLRLRCNVRGAKKGAYHRAVPLHPDLVRRLRGWGLPAAGLLFVSHNKLRRDGPGVHAEESLHAPFRRAWAAAKVDPQKWGATPTDPAGRAHGRPAHVFRSVVKTNLLRQAVSEEIAALVIGHATTATQRAYRPELEPLEQPCWAEMVRAIATIPTLDL